MKTMIAVPSMDQVPMQFTASLALLQKTADCSLAIQMGSLIYNARNDLARQAIETEADYVLWLDSDMVFPADTLTRLLKLKDRAGMVSGLYFRRSQPFTPVVYETLENTAEGPFFTEFKKIPDEIFECAGIGFGCVLMSAEVLFDVLAKYPNPFEPMPGFGEDLTFCWRARELGHKIICDPSMSLGHVGHHIITREFYEAFNKGGTTT